MKNKMKNNSTSKISDTKLAIIITAITSVAVSVLLAVMLVTHADPELTKIEILSPPYKTEYIEKQRLDTSGLNLQNNICTTPNLSSFGSMQLVISKIRCKYSKNS